MEGRLGRDRMVGGGQVPGGDVEEGTEDKHQAPGKRLHHGVIADNKLTFGQKIAFLCVATRYHLVRAD